MNDIQIDGMLRDATSAMDRQKAFDIGRNSSILRKMAALAGQKSMAEKDLREHIKFLEEIIEHKDGVIEAQSKNIADLTGKVETLERLLARRQYAREMAIEERMTMAQKFDEPPELRRNPETGEPT